MEKEIQRIICLLDELETKFNKCTENQTTIDLKLSDILHFIQNNPIHPTKDYYIIKKLIDLRKEREQNNKDVRVYNKFKTLEKRLLERGNRKLLLSDIMKEASIEPYKNRIYNNIKEELKK